MPAKPIVCDQAVFTSARGPTGEGYRIVAAGKGLRPEEKQKITRCSPSHESLCIPSEGTEPAGVAFYPLPTGRLCVAVSRHAGAEQSGRGGLRVYTHNVLVNADDFAACGSNPLAIARAIPRVELDLTKPTTSAILTPLELVVEDAVCRFDPSLLPAAVRMAAALQFVEQKSLIVDLPGDWFSWAEGFVLALPAPLRGKTSFAAGIRFSASRGHCLCILHDKKKPLGSRSPLQGDGYFDAKSSSAPPHSSWLAFVDRHWSKGDLKGLSNRTSRHYEDCSATGRERVGALFNTIDTISTTDTLPLLDAVFATFNAPQHSVEGQVRMELRDAAQQELWKRLMVAVLPQVRPVWTRLIEFWRNGGQPAVFAQPLLHAVMTATLRSDSLAAAELALSISQAPPGIDRHAHDLVLTRVADHLASHASTDTTNDSHRGKLLARLQALLPATTCAAS